MLPNPQELDLLLTYDLVDDYKRYDCATYTKCLDIAEDAGWQQFHCNDCSAYIALPKDDPSRKLFGRAGLVKLAKLIKNGRNR